MNRFAQPERTGFKSSQTMEDKANLHEQNCCSMHCRRRAGNGKTGSKPHLPWSRGHHTLEHLLPCHSPPPGGNIKETPSEQRKLTSTAHRRLMASGIPMPNFALVLPPDRESFCTSGNARSSSGHRTRRQQARI